MIRPNRRFLFAHPAHLIALGFGSGLVRPGPGTAGTALGWLMYPLLRASVPDDAMFGLFVAMSFLAGILVCERTGRALGVADHGSVVWDEIVAIWLVLMFAPPAPGWQLIAFALFRFFDIVKPPPIRWVDAHTRGGFGVMLDDLLAAAFSILALALLVRLGL